MHIEVSSEMLLICTLPKILLLFLTFPSQSDIVITSQMMVAVLGAITILKYHLQINFSMLNLPFRNQFTFEKNLKSKSKKSIVWD